MRQSAHPAFPFLLALRLGSDSDIIPFSTGFCPSVVREHYRLFFGVIWRLKGSTKVFFFFLWEGQFGFSPFFFFVCFWWEGSRRYFGVQGGRGGQ